MLISLVIDTGQVREVRQNERTSTATLVTDWCSKASAKQRAGRAGAFIDYFYIFKSQLLDKK